MHAWLSAGAMAAVIAATVGCASSVRYTRDADTGRLTSYKVPANWDYRKYYQVPAQRLKTVVDSYLGVPYRYGGTSRKGVDCSGLVFLVFRDLNHAKAPRSTRQLRKTGRQIPERDARPGDLVFFRGGLFNTVNHVGIYMGDGRYVHASSKSGVVYESVEGDYYRKHYAGTRRVF